ncbi:hypothetical protein PAPYR_11186 [Paratrimastix pyriformis]|uniref:Uncharacterized protein n=1 Tax=Paratrimastix pyriformis TaxID=342808 RepID=A0ABQ8U497_9EUKA|nr:hypothetical protein PAPYR_11186 [Paratrimastix pyriformis]
MAGARRVLQDGRIHQWAIRYTTTSGVKINSKPRHKGMETRRLKSIFSPSWLRVRATWRECAYEFVQWICSANSRSDRRWSDTRPSAVFICDVIFAMQGL